MSILKELSELVKEGIVSEEIAENIQSYYSKKEKTSTNKLFVVFGVLGAILVGLGIILILAHNWDELPRLVKTIFAFIPLIIGQLICGYVLLKMNKNTTWKESAAVFLFFAVGASISLVSQIYNIPGDLSSFILTWMLLCLPLVYIMKSSITSLLYIIGITFYACKLSYWTYPQEDSYLYWILLLAILPYYYFLYKRNAKSNFTTFHNWLIPLSVIIALGTITKNYPELMFVAYISLFGLLYLIGQSAYFRNQKLRNNGYTILGSLGTIGVLLALSFRWFWDELKLMNFKFETFNDSIELIAILILTSAASYLLIKKIKTTSIIKVSPIEPVFIIFIILFLIGLKSSISIILINLLVFIIGILIVKKGAKENHLGILNYGLLIITALVVCRFFDTDLSFVIRGLLFVSVGVGFFITNYWMLKKRKTHEN